MNRSVLSSPLLSLCIALKPQIVGECHTKLFLITTSTNLVAVRFEHNFQSSLFFDTACKMLFGKMVKLKEVMQGFFFMMSPLFSALSRPALDHSYKLKSNKFKLWLQPTRSCANLLNSQRCVSLSKSFLKVTNFI